MTKAEDFKNATNATTETLLGLVNRWVQFEYEDGTGHTVWISSYTPETNKMDALVLDEYHKTNGRKFFYDCEWDVQIEGLSIMINGKKVESIWRKSECLKK